MASRLRLTLRAQLPRQLSCPQTRHFTLSSTLQASKPRAKPPSQPIRLRSQQPPPSTSRSIPPPRPPPSSNSSKSSSSSSTSDSSTPQPLDVLFKQRSWPFIGASVAAMVMGLYISTVITSSLNKSSSDSPSSDPQPAPTTPSIPNPCSCAPTGLPSTLSLSEAPSPTSHQTATSFDASLDLPERMSGIKGLRKQLAARARGHVLEVAVGTGRNLGYYDWSEVVSATQDDEETREKRQKERVMKLIEASTTGGGKDVNVKDGLARGVGSLEGEVLSFTGVDLSGDMVGVARDRVREAVPGLSKVMRRKRAEPMPRLNDPATNPDSESEIVVVDALGSRIRLVLADAMRGLPAPPQAISSPHSANPSPTTPPPQKYDTILQTFGLCSVPNPTTLLAHMASHLQPDTGRILLLEHGRGHYEWINKLLDDYAPRHFQKYGCWWNRDIEAVVRDAAEAVPGLEVVSVERPLFLQAGTTLVVELRVRGRKEEGKGKA